MNTENYFKDSVGNIILEGDLIRMFHFRTSGKKYYMYKIAKNYVDYKDKKALELKDIHCDHIFKLLPTKDYSRYLDEMVVVSRADFHNDYNFDELKRNTLLRD